jgi:hypothetical protein
MSTSLQTQPTEPRRPLSRRARACTPASLLTAVMLCLAPALACAVTPDAPAEIQVLVKGGEAGDPVEGARVHVMLAEEDAEFEKDAVTNDQGVATLRGIPKRKVRIQVTATNWKTFGKIYDLTSLSGPIVTTLQRPEQ